MGLATGSLDSPDAVRRAMATLQTQMAALQQDRDTVAAQLASAKDQITNLEMTKASLEDQIASLTRNLQASRGDTKSKETAVYTLEKELALKTSEINRLADKGNFLFSPNSMSQFTVEHSILQFEKWRMQ